MGRKRDEFWEYVDSENKCIFCGEKIPGASRIKYHLAQIPGGGIILCKGVPDDVKKKAVLAFNNPDKRVKLSTNDVEENNINADLGSSSTRGEIEVDLLPATDLVGFKFKYFYLEKIRKWLMRDEVDVSIMGVWGMGGVGKTALLKDIRRELVIRKSHVIWITVSQNYSIRQLQREIADSINEIIQLQHEGEVIAAVKLLQHESEVTAADKLSLAFREMKKCVVILDDVWYDIFLEDVGIPLKDNGIKIIVASRLLDVCRSIGCGEDVVKVEPLGVLPFCEKEEDFGLFSKSLGDHVILPKDITDIAKELTKECKGLPLAIIAIARSMRGKTDIREWRTPLSKLKRIEMDHVFPVLKSSYDRLNDKTLQDCFLSLPLYFVDGDRIHRKDLIRNFVDEGLIDQMDSKVQFDEGHSILNKLIDNRLLEGDEDYRSVWLHKLVWAMAINIGKESHGYMHKAKLPDEREWEEDLQKICLMCYERAEIPFDMAPKCPKLSTLRMFGFHFILPNDFFMNMPALKILDLSWTESIEGLPGSISNLVCLTVLLLYRCTSLHHIPSLARLRQLRRLDLSYTAITQVPPGFENLTNLRWLRLEGTAVAKAQFLKWLPMLESIGATFVDKDDFNECIQIIQNRINSGMIRGYFLRLVGDGTRVLTNDEWRINIDSDKTIEIEGVEHCKLLLPSDIDELKIKDCNQWRSLCDVLSIQQSNNRLHISKCNVLSCNKLEYLFCSSDGCILCSFLDLNELHLDGLQSLSMLCKENEMASSCSPFSCLTKLSVGRCDSMKKLLTLEMSKLEEIDVSVCMSVEEIISTEKSRVDVLWLPVEMEANGVDMDGTNVEEINLLNLKSVSLWNLPQLTSVCKGTIVCSSLKKFIIADCPKLKCVPKTRPPFDIQVLDKNCERIQLSNAITWVSSE